MRVNSGSFMAARLFALVVNVLRFDGPARSVRRSCEAFVWMLAAIFPSSWRSTSFSLSEYTNRPSNLARHTMSPWLFVGPNPGPKRKKMRKSAGHSVQIRCSS
jgi:hypothetical protein